MITVIGLGVEKGDLSRRGEEIILNGVKNLSFLYLNLNGTIRRLRRNTRDEARDIADQFIFNLLNNGIYCFT